MILAAPSCGDDQMKSVRLDMTPQEAINPAA